MARPVFKYYLFNENKLPLYRDSATGLIKTGDANLQQQNGQPANIKYAPDGWKDTMLKYARNLKYTGLFRDMTEVLQAYGDFADILLQRFWDANGGIENITYFSLHKLNKSLLPYAYELWHEIEIDFLKFNQTKNGVKFQALEGGLSKFLKANEDTQYTIPIDTDAEVVQLLNDGLPIDNSALFSIYPDQAIGNHIVGTQVVQKEIASYGDINDVINTTSGIPNVNSNIRATNNAIFVATVDGDLTVDWDFILTMFNFDISSLNPALVINSELRVIKPDNTTSTTLNFVNVNNILNIIGNHATSGNSTITLHAGDEVYFYTYGTVPGAPHGVDSVFFSYGGNLSIKLSYTYRFPATTFNCLLPLTVAKRLLEKMSDTTGIYSIQSTFLTNRNKDILLSSGDGVRGLVLNANFNITGSSLVTSFSDFFKAFDSQYGIGIGIQGDKIIIEELPYFFQDDVQILDIGELSEWSIYPAEDLQYSSGRFGGKVQEYQGINGKYETNQGQNWKFPHNKFSKKLDKENPYRTDPYGIELYRNNFTGKTTTDSQEDNDTFMFNVVRSANIVNYIATKTTQQDDVFPFAVKFDSLSSPLLFSPTPLKDSFTYIGATQYTNLQIFTKIIRPTDTRHVQVDLMVNGVSVSTWPIEADGSAQTIVATGVVLNNGDVLSVQVNFGLGVVNHANVLEMTMTIYFPNIYQYELYRPTGAVITGVPHPEGYYNYFLSPTNAMLRNGAYLHSIMDRQEADQIVMTSADKNTNLSVTFNGITIKEGQPTTVASLPKKLFLPYYINGKTQVPFNFQKTMDSNPYGKIKFTINGNPFFAFMFDGGVKPATNDVQTWQMLSCVGNDFSKIKRGQSIS
jgi:hypothetical protein